MATTTVTLIGSVADAIGVDFDSTATKVWVVYNTPTLVTDGSDPIRLGAHTQDVTADGTFSLPNVVASTSLYENLTATVMISYKNTAGSKKTRDEATLGPYDLTGLSGTVDVRTLEVVQALDASVASQLMSEMTELRDDASDEADRAEAAADLATDISGISTSDGVITAIDNNPASAFRVQSDARLLSSIDDKVTGDVGDLTTPIGGAVLARVASPRDTSRVKVERKPVLAFDQMFPNAWTDHRIVGTNGDHTLYGIGHDNSLRVSSDDGATWPRKLSNSGGLGQWAMTGLFLRLANGNLLTTYHPYDLSAPKIQRSTDGGGTWADVVAAQTNVDYLGPTSICQDPVTGYVYLTEYVSVNAATKATWKIIRSTDNGATWSTFHTFQRDATANPTTAVRHGHGIQWDPVGLRIYFMCGDGEQAAGLYRVNAGGTDVEAIVTNSMVAMDTGVSPDMVGIMFFPNYIAWGVDRVSDSHLVRMARTEIGDPTPVVEQIARLQSTGFYCILAKSDYTEWLMSVSNEDGGGGRVDNACHLYRVSDDAAIVDEVHAEAVGSGTAFFWTMPVSNPLAITSDGRFWINSTVKALTDKDVGKAGWQASARLVWGSRSLVKPDVHRKMFYDPDTLSSGIVSLTQNQTRVFAKLQVPLRAKRLFIINCGVNKLSGSGLPYFQAWNANTGLQLTDASGVSILDQYNSMRTNLNEESAPYVFVTTALTPGHIIELRLVEANVNTCDANAFFTVAWGI